jgi:hypothetical protein
MFFLLIAALNSLNHLVKILFDVRMFVVYYPVKVSAYSELADPYLKLCMVCFNMITAEDGFWGSSKYSN